MDATWDPDDESKTCPFDFEKEKLKLKQLCGKIIKECEIPGSRWSNDGLILRMDFFRQGRGKQLVPDGKKVTSTTYQLNEIAYWPIAWDYFDDVIEDSDLFEIYAEAVENFLKDNWGKDKGYPN